jgi:hypothetical protein
MTAVVKREATSQTPINRVRDFHESRQCVGNLTENFIEQQQNRIRCAALHERHHSEKKKRLDAEAMNRILQQQLHEAYDNYSRELDMLRKRTADTSDTCIKYAKLLNERDEALSQLHAELSRKDSNITQLEQSISSLVERVQRLENDAGEKEHGGKAETRLCDRSTADSALRNQPHRHGLEGFTHLRGSPPEKCNASSPPRRPFDALAELSGKKTNNKVAAETSHRDDHAKHVNVDCVPTAGDLLASVWSAASQPLEVRSPESPRAHFEGQEDTKMSIQLGTLFTADQRCKDAVGRSCTTMKSLCPQDDFWGMQLHSPDPSIPKDIHILPPIGDHVCPKVVRVSDCIRTVDNGKQHRGEERSGGLEGPRRIATIGTSDDDPVLARAQASASEPGHSYVPDDHPERSSHQKDVVSSPQTVFRISQLRAELYELVELRRRLEV